MLAFLVLCVDRDALAEVAARLVPRGGGVRGDGPQDAPREG
jgi:hypothetical protein